MFGKPNNVHYSPNIVNDVDTSGILLLEYDNFKVVCIAAKDTFNNSYVNIQGAQGIQGQKGEKGERGDQGLSPNFAFTLEENGDLFVDINYGTSSNVTPATPNTTSAATKTYDVVWGIAQAGAPGPIRGYLEYSALSGFGKLHLDMKVTGNGSGNGGVLCTLPNDAPVPARLLETSVDASNNSVYIEPNSRVVKGWGVAGNNKRYILDIVGFWKEI